MNLKLPLLASLIFATHAMNAQDYSGFNDLTINGEKTFYGGIVAGTNITRISGMNTGSAFHKVGANVGAAVHWKFNDYFGFNMEILYSQKGARQVWTLVDPSVGTYQFKYFLDLNYMEVPLMLSIRGNDRFQFLAGGAISYLFKSKEWAESFEPINLESENAPFKKLDLQLVGGVNINIYKGFYLSGRYQFSVKPVRDAYYVPSIVKNYKNQLNRQIVIKAGYWF